MVRTALAVSTVVLLSACASTLPKPPTVTEMLMGTWACESPIGPAVLKTQQTYQPGGKASFHLDVAGAQGAMKVEAAGDGSATWKLLEGDTKMELKLNAVTVTSAKLNGMTIDPAMAQSMIGPYIAGQSTTTAIEITPATLKLTGADSTTNCTRPPKTK